MAQEINCSCEITENEVIICYPPISSGGGGSIGGSGTVNTLPKFTPNGTTLGDSGITDDGTSVGISRKTTITSVGGGFGLIADFQPQAITFTGLIGGEILLLENFAIQYGTPSTGITAGNILQVNAATRKIETSNVTIGQLALLSTGLQGTAGQVLTTNGAGVLSWTTVGGGGITGVAPVGNVAKVATVDTGDVILTLDESSIDETTTTTSILRDYDDDNQIITFTAKADTDASGVTATLQSNKTSLVRQFSVNASDLTTDGILIIEPDLVELKVANTGAADIINLQIDGAAENLLILTSNLNGGIFCVEGAADRITIGDWTSQLNSTRIIVDDASSLITLNAMAGIEINGFTAASGTFEDANGLIVTVTHGLITSIV